MSQPPGLTEAALLGLCQRTFPDRANQTINGLGSLGSRQHEMVKFRLRWSTPLGEQDERMVARRYVSSLSWWRPEDLGKAQREATVTEWLYGQGFPVPQVYAREFSALGDIVLFSRIPGVDWSHSDAPFPEVVRPHVRRFAQILATLHKLEPPPSVRNVTPSVTLHSALATLMALAFQIRLPELSRAIEDAMKRVYQIEETTPVLLHGDYHFSNVLLYEDQISGIVDWEYTAIGDPRWDIANAYSQLVDFDAAGAADEFLAAYLEYSGRNFSGPPLYLVVAPLQQWTISEWLVREQGAGRSATFDMAQDLMALRDTHRHRAQMALRWLEE